MKIEIRKAIESDLDEIILLCKDHADYEQSAYDSKGKKEQLRQHLFSDRPALFCIMAELDGAIVGYATYMKQFSTWDGEFYIYMDCLYLRESARSQGIGEQLVNFIKTDGAQLGCQLIQWQTPDFNIRAIKFYKRIGAVGKSKERFFLNI